MTASNDFELKILNHVFGKGTYTPPTNIYVALLTGTPVDSDGGAEIVSKETTYGGYVRKLTSPADWRNAYGDGQIDNNVDLEFIEGTSGSGIITHFALLDGNALSAADNVIVYGTVTPNISVGSGVQPKFKGFLTTTPSPGQLVVTCD